jgi:chromosome segregation ATPase
MDNENIETQETQNEVLEQAEVQPEDLTRDTEALQKSYKELQSSFTKKAQELQELKRKVESTPSREDIIWDYLLSQNKGETPPVIVSSSSAFDFAKEKKPTSLAEAHKLAREFFYKKEN